jgi:hypothetical protein
MNDSMLSPNEQFEIFNQISSVNKNYIYYLMQSAYIIDNKDDLMKVCSWYKLNHDVDIPDNENIIDNDIFIEVEGYTFGGQGFDTEPEEHQDEEYNIEVSNFNNFSYYW